MKLYDYISLMPDGEELTVWDKSYDIETYFYGGEDSKDRWHCAMNELSKLLTITKIRTNGVYVDLSEMILKNISKLEKSGLFIRCDIDSIMDDIEEVLAGFVSEEWMEQFVATLNG